MRLILPFLSTYDPPGTGEGSIDPLGLAQISERLAEQLLPGVRERMQRARFLTALTVGTFVTEGLEDDPRKRDASPSLVWEWLVVEAFLRSFERGPRLAGLPGIDVTRRALAGQSYLDARNYLKTPRVFGFNGVYKRLAVHIGLVDVHLLPGPHATGLAEAWSRSRGYKNFGEARPIIEKWRQTVARCLRESTPRTKVAGFSEEVWRELAEAFALDDCKSQERQFLRSLLLGDGQSGVMRGALPEIWAIFSERGVENLEEETLHDQLYKHSPRFRTLLLAIRSYEAFARSLLDGFDLVLAEASMANSHGRALSVVAAEGDLQICMKGVERRFAAAYDALAEIQTPGLSLRQLFSDKFQAFGEPMTPTSHAAALCALHEQVQQSKSDAGKKPWFDRMDGDCLHVRAQYRKPRRELATGRFVGLYRGFPVSRFYRDLT